MQTFDFEAFKKEAACQLNRGEPLLGSDSVFIPLLKGFLEEALEGEMEAHTLNKHQSRTIGTDGAEYG